MDWESSTPFEVYDEIQNEALEEMSLPHIYKPFFLHHVCTDLKEMNYVSKKEKFKKYACIRAYYKHNIHSLSK